MVELKQKYITKNDLTPERFNELSNKNLLTLEMEEAYYILEELKNLLIPNINMYLEIGYIKKDKTKTLQDALSYIEDAAFELIRGEVEALLNRKKIF